MAEVLAVEKAIEEASKQIGIRLKEKQFEAIKQFCWGNDVFVSLPTGYGKSLIYGVIPLVFDKMKGKYP